jgi:hypothetical protein
LEEKRSEVKRHFKVIGATADDPVFVLAFSRRRPVPDCALPLKHKPALIIVDPLFRFTRMKDANDYAAVTSALEPLHALARQTDAHVSAPCS